MVYSCVRMSGEVTLRIDQELSASCGRHKHPTFRVRRLPMVKKATQAIPNHLLRRARLERGWTQQVVAERIGAPNNMMVTRWERGKAFPSPYYIERLCQLFEQRASDLGLLRESSPQVVTPVSQPLPGRSHRSLSSDEQTGKKVSPATLPLSHTVSSSPLSHLPLIGREADVRALRAVYQVVEQGQTQVVLIQGEAGIGKTHLASAFLQWASTQGAALLQGRAFEMGGRLPYQPLVHALSRHLEAEPAPETLLSATWLSELSHILPELRDRSPHLPLVMGDEMAARIRLFEAVTRLGQALCEHTTVILFLDDIQWADAASLERAALRWATVEREWPAPAAAPLGALRSPGNDESLQQVALQPAP